MREVSFSATRKISHWTGSLTSELACLASKPQDHPISTSPVVALPCRTWSYPAFYTGAENPNSDPHVYVANNLPTEPFPWPIVLPLIWNRVSQSCPGLLWTPSAVTWAFNLQTSALQVAGIITCATRPSTKTTFQKNFLRIRGAMECIATWLLNSPRRSVAK